jgi:hypothetical protein
MRKLIFVALLILLAGCNVTENIDNNDVEMETDSQVENKTVEVYDILKDNEDWECIETECYTYYKSNDISLKITYTKYDEYILSTENFFSFHLKMIDSEFSALYLYFYDENELNVGYIFGTSNQDIVCDTANELECSSVLPNTTITEDPESLVWNIIEYIESYI